MKKMKPMTMKKMKWTPRKDNPSEPVISKSECWAGLRLVGLILDGIVEQGDVPEQVVEMALEFSSRLQTFREQHGIRLNGDQAEALESAIATGLLPTFGQRNVVFVA
jgi:hypothetical protein